MPLARSHRLGFAIAFLWIATAASAKPPKNWAAAPYWVPPASHTPRVAGRFTAQGDSVLPAALPFFAVSPCRAYDTRQVADSPALAAGSQRDFQIEGVCAIPAEAEAVSFNVTVTQAEGAGHLVLWPQGGSLPSVATMSYTTGATVSNAAIVPLGATGQISALAAVSGTHVIFDVNGYYAPEAHVESLNTLTGALEMVAGDNVVITSLDATTIEIATTVEAGATGATGATGPQGLQGLQGIQGPQGLQGSVGATGATGARGLTWRGAWDNGTTYEIDDAVRHLGSIYVSLTGSNLGNEPEEPSDDWDLLAQRGEDGADGATGPQGPTGNDGAPGTQGATGLQGASGPAGPTGGDGAQGPQGPAGAQGPQGPQGPQGLPGANGAQGPQGPQGPQGLPGANGAQGPQGPQGPQGLRRRERRARSAGTPGAPGSAGSGRDRRDESRLSLERLPRLRQQRLCARQQLVSLRRRLSVCLGGRQCAGVRHLIRQGGAAHLLHPKGLPR